MPKAKAQKAVLSAKLHQTSQKYATEATADLSTDSFKDLRTKIESQFKKLDQKGAGTNKGAAKKPEPSKSIRPDKNAKARIDRGKKRDRNGKVIGNKVDASVQSAFAVSKLENDTAVDE